MDQVIVRSVTSGSNAEVTYKVTMNVKDGQVVSYTCECRDYVYRVAKGLKDECKHLYWAL